MKHTINAKQLRASLPEIVQKVGQGDQFTVLYRSRPAFRIVQVDAEDRSLPPLEQDPLYQAGPLGASSDGLTAADHDLVLYGGETR